jgi:hypothetical protein
MTDAPELPPFAEPYLEDFRVLARMIERTPGFVLLPVESPSPDLARAFAQWLAERGVIVDLLGIDDAELPQRLTESKAPRSRVVIVVAPNDFDMSAIRQTLAAVNWARDRIAEQLGCPVLWWGSKAFLRVTWEGAPDLWSVAGLPYRIPLRRLVDVPEQLSYGSYWWTGAIDDDTTELEAALERANQGADDPEVARLGLRLAEVQILRRDPSTARETLAAVYPAVDRSARQLLGRYDLLKVAASSGEAEPIGLMIAQLREQIADSVRRGARRTEAGLRLRLARALEPSEVVEAVQEFWMARTIIAELGDVDATLSLDFRLVFDLFVFLDPSMRGEIMRYAEQVEERGGDPKTLAMAALIRAKGASVEQDYTRAEELAVVGARRAEEAGHPALALAALPIRAFIAYERGDFEACLALTEAWIEGAHAADNMLVLFQGYILRATALERLERPLEAAHELALALGVAAVMGVDRWGAAILCRIAAAARRAGDDGVAAHLAVNALFLSWRGVNEVWEGLEPEAWSGKEGAAVVGAATRLLGLLDDQPPEGSERKKEWEASLDSTIASLIVECKRLDDALSRQGVRPVEIATWRVRSA